VYQIEPDGFPLNAIVSLVYGLRRDAELRCLFQVLFELCHVQDLGIL
jgi:hypothetical protein